MSSYLPKAVRLEVRRRDGGKCVICQSEKSLEYAHLVAKHRGILKEGLRDDPRYRNVMLGADEPANIVLLCHRCHNLSTWWINPKRYDRQTYRKLRREQNRISYRLKEIELKLQPDGPRVINPENFPKRERKESIDKLGEIYSKARNELRFGYDSYYDNDQNTHDFAGAIIHYVLGHDYCKDNRINTIGPEKSRALDLKIKLNKSIQNRFGTTPEVLAQRRGWTFAKMAEFCLREKI